MDSNIASGKAIVKRLGNGGSGRWISICFRFSELRLESSLMAQKTKVARHVGAMAVFVVIGWAVAYAQNPRAQRNQAAGRVYFERIDARVSCIFSCNYHSPEEREKFQRRELIGCVSEAWRFQDVINASMKGVPRKDVATKDADVAISLAKESLWLLGFKKADKSTAQDFIAFVEKAVPNNGGNFMPEIHDPASAERRSYVQFVAKALEFNKFKP